MVLFSLREAWEGTRLAADAHYPAEFEHELPLARSRIVALEAELAALRALRAREDDLGRAAAAAGAAVAPSRIIDLKAAGGTGAAT